MTPTATSEEPVERVGERDRDGCGGEADPSDHPNDGGHTVAQVARHTGYEGEHRDAERPWGIGERLVDSHENAQRVRPLDLRVRFPINDQTVSDLHARVFGYPVGAVHPWGARLQRHTLTWIGAFDVDTLIRFVHACWDGGSHAFVLGTAVDPDHQRRGVGRALVQSLAHLATAAGCEWLHVDYESHLKSFYQHACSFRTPDAGLLHLTQ